MDTVDLTRLDYRRRVDPLPRTPRIRRRIPVLRIIVLCWIASFALRALFRGTMQVPVSAPPPVLVSPVPGPQGYFEDQPKPDVATLERYVVWRSEQATAGRKQLKKFVEGQEIRWTGTLKKSAWPGRFDLMEDPSRGKESVRLVPVTADAKDDLRRIDTATRIEVDGVLMDEHSVHIVSVREIR